MTRWIAMVAMLSIAWAVVPGAQAQPRDVDTEIAEAKALYREARFVNAVAKLQSVIDHLRMSQRTPTQTSRLAEAHLHVALSYVALNDPAAAKEALKAMLRIDPRRHLDPEIYAPKVIDLMQEATAELESTPTATTLPALPPMAPSSRPTPASRKGGSKTVPIILGVGGAVAAGTAIAAAGSDGTPATPGSTPTPNPTATATPPPTVSGPEDIAFIGSDPPPGGTVSIGGSGLRITLSVVFSRSGNYRLSVQNFRPADSSDFRECVPGESPFITLVAGQATTFQIEPFGRPTASCLARLPVTTTEFTASLSEGTDLGGSTVVRRIFNLGWTWAR